MKPLLPTLRSALLLVAALTAGTHASAQLPSPCPSNLEPPADFCQSMCVFCNYNGAGFLSTTAGYTGQTPPGFCGSIDNEQWLGFIAGGSAAIFTATPMNCQIGNGIQMALYSDCNSAPIECNAGANGLGNTPLSMSAQLNPGVTYYLVVDGFAGDQCDFTVTVSPETAAQPPSVGPTGIVSGPTIVCPGSTARYTVPPVTGAGAYTWTAPPGSTINGQNAPLQLLAPGGHSVDITFGSTGGQICVFPQNSCAEGTQRCVNVQVQPIPPTIFPPAIICNEDRPYELPWGQQAFSSGTYQIALVSHFGCDSLLRQQVIVRPPIINFQPPVPICRGDTVRVLGRPFTQGGFYSITGTSYEGCDSTINLTLIALDPIAEIHYDGMPIPCDNGMAFVSSMPSPGSVKIWRDLNGNVRGAGDSLTATQPGLYVLDVTSSLAGKICTELDTIAVPSADSLLAGVFWERISCTAARLVAQATDPTLPVTWLGPDGFFSPDSVVVVSNPGVYYAVVIDTLSGCTDARSLLIQAGAGLQLNEFVRAPCGADSVQLSPVLVSPTTTAFEWMGPGGFASNLPEPVVVDSGLYVLIVADSSVGCSDTASIFVSFDNAFPEAVVDEVKDATDGLANGAIALFVEPADAEVDWYSQGEYVASGAQITGLPAGVYYYIVTSSNGCSVADSVVVNAVSASNDPEHAASEWRLFPNPASGILVLERQAGDGHTAVDLEVLSVTGQQVWSRYGVSGKVINLTPDELQPGTYVLRIRGVDRVEAHAFMLIR